MSDRKAELERKKLRLQQIREEKKRKEEEKKKREVHAVSCHCKCTVCVICSIVTGQTLNHTFVLLIRQSVGE